MTREPASGPLDREIGPGRFQQPDGPEDSRNRAAALGAGLLLLLLVVGIPVALVSLGGVPQIPTSLPSRDQLTATLDITQVLAVLVWVVWLAWLQFTVCVAVEFRSALSGVGLPRRVPLAGPSQRLARVLVVSVLLISTAAGQASAAVASVLPEHGPSSASSISVSVDGGAATPTPVVDTAAATAAATEQAAVQGETTYWLGDMQLSPEEGMELAGQRVYVVQPPDGRYHDNLWDIAERSLGDGRRYHEVFELNKHRDQPDGHALTLERLIYPNWLLVMPEDAVGVERVTAIVTPVAAVEPAPVIETPVAATDVAAAAETSVPGSGAVVQAESQDGIGTAGLVGAGLLAAGLLVAVDQLRRRRRTDEPSPDAVEVEVALRIGADPQRAILLDRGLRQLAEGLRAAGHELPGVFGAVVDDTGVELRLSPPSTAAPAPWRVLGTGAAWRLDAADVDLDARTGTAPFPGLVSLGRDADDRDVLIDLEAAQGPIAIVGDLDVAREVASAWAAELVTNRWSDGLHVTGVDLPDGLDALPGGRYDTAASAADVLPRLRERRADVLGSSVLTGRLRSGGAGTWVPEYLVLGSTPVGSAAQQLVELTATSQRSPLGVVCVGALPGARWQLVAEADGRLSARVLDLDVRANRLTSRQVTALGELLTEAPEPARAVDEKRAAIEHEGAVERPPVVAPARTVEPADLEAALVRVLVLGEPRVETPRTIEDSRRALATELVVYLALHPEGAHANVLAAALWPRGVTTEVRESLFARTAEWLGTDVDGKPNLVRGDDGHVRLSEHVVVDWDVVRSLLARARRAADPAAERSDLAAALRLARGAVLSARPAGRYSWLARVRLERASQALLVDTVHRLVVLCRDGDDPAGAQSVAWAGLRLAPTEELLWRDLVRAAAALGGADAVRPVARDLEATLHAAGAPTVSPATRALLEELAPGYDDAVLGSA
ncbi:LysM peptidoglycan-binding domain-containing protein [Cellulomonas xylanilytica]|uniref:Bacterial transcriptional activator domain-containing protein n=1 Tax=Cellulomonas xylanilytica TaxID=233583 RepID=A0A510V7Q2_9CELL|nr:hypothetical protein [Cellulomonas xylanilytica]GEK22907.1 hypothetical protein CXY01_34270 [Cellulomonas xylanilytica]